MASAGSQHHEHNKEVLASVASTLPPSTSGPKINPLLARGKLKPAKKPNSSTNKAKKGKSKELVQDVKEAKQDELNVISQDDPTVDQAEQGDVLDLADQLLEQLDSQLGANDAPVVSSQEIEPQASNSSSTSKSSTSSSGTARERFNDFKEGMRDAFMPNRHQESGGDKKVSRQQARKLRKANHFEEQKQQAAAEVLAENDRSVELEKSQIDTQLKRLKVHVKEVNPDGHCLFSAIADQANFLKLAPTKEDYQSTRTHAANYLRSHADDFLPFLVSDADPDMPMSTAEYSRYCDTVEKTAEWGGEPEIRALSLHYQSPIYVVQAGTTEPVAHGEDLPTDRAMLISYHRKQYGLGEHYNSLRPSTHGAPHVVTMLASAPTAAA
ncbi:deubiquitinase OTU2 [Sporobolomyces salmoneus]|uniref:deubiquitinase OTU2 n=1 Tax=Sporobolomyces salmoneus TaxID=183962 RepID=UPI00317036B2